MTIPPDPAATSWHLDKRVPIALIVTILIQSGGAIWWAATTTGRVTAVEESLRSSVTSRLNRIEDKLDRLIESRIRAELSSNGSG